MQVGGDRLIKHATVRAVASGLTFIGIFGLVTSNLGHFSSQLNQILALLLLTVLVALYVPKRLIPGRPVGRRHLLVAGVALVVAIITWTVGGDIERCIAVVFVLVSLDWAGRALGAAQPRLSGYVLAGILISLYVIVEKRVPPAWYAVQGFSQFLSLALSHLTSQGMLMNATAAGTHILVFFLIYVLSFTWLADARQRKSLAAVVLLAFLIQAVYLIASGPVFVPLLKIF